MTKDKGGINSPSPVNVPICDPFDAECGAPVTFEGAPSGASITKSGNVWPFVDSKGDPYTDPISFPLVGNVQIYIGEDLTVGTTYPYSVNNAACSQDVIKGVTIVDGARMKKSA